MLLLFNIINHILNPSYQGMRCNIQFKKATGFTVLMNIPQIAKMDDIIKEYSNNINKRSYNKC